MTRLIRGEFRRIFATRLPVWSAALAVATGALFTGLIGLVGPENATPPLPGLDTPEGIAIVLGINGLLLFIPALIGTIAITGEYRHRTVGTTFLVAPRRGSVLAAKLLVFAVVGLGYGALMAGSAGLALVGAAAAHGVSLGATSGEIGLLLLRLAIAAAVYVLLGVAIGALARQQLVAVGIVLGYFYFLEPMLMILPGINLAYPYLPGGATAALLDFTFLGDAISSELPILAPQTLSALAGAGILVTYAAVAAAAAIAVPLRRDLR
ncbi:ABC transporter permease [Agromyces bauzanensis]